MATHADLPKVIDCNAHIEEHATADSQPVGQRLRSVKTSADSKKWKQQYKSLLADYQDQQEDLEEVNYELSDTHILLCEEKTKRLQANAKHAELKEDLEKLYGECDKMKQLLASRDQKIASLVGQVNLLIQVGSMKRLDGESTTDASSEQSRSRSNRSLFSSETGSFISDSNRSLLSSDTGSSISSLASFFIAPRRPSGMERKTQTNEDTLNTSLTSFGQSRFDTRRPNAANRRSWSETMKLSDEVLPSQPRRVSAPYVHY
jgi:hypothetical protein